MSEWAWIVTLLSTGNLLELVGVGLVVKEISDVGKAVRDFETRPQTLNIHGAVSSQSAGRARATGGREPTLEERVQSLEQDMSSLRTELDETRSKLRHEWHDDIDASEKRVQSWTGDKLEAIRRLLLSITTGGSSLKMLGVLLITCGILLSLIANVMAMVRSG